jgi:hypothetical protein
MVIDPDSLNRAGPQAFIAIPAICTGKINVSHIKASSLPHFEKILLYYPQ